MKNYFFNGINSTTVLAPIGLFFAFYIKALSHSYQENIAHLKVKNEPKDKGSNPAESIATESFKKSYVPLFPMVQTEKQADSAQCKK